MEDFTITRKRLFDVIREKVSNSKEEQKRHAVEFIVNEMQKQCPSNTILDVGFIRKQVDFVTWRIHERWEKCHRNLKFFETKFSSWLNESEYFHMEREVKRLQNPGRPSITFEEASDRTKRMKTESLRETTSVKELLFATSMKLRTEGYEQAAKLVHMLYENPSAAEDILKSHLNPVPPPIKLNDDEAVALIIEADLSKAQYLLIRSIGINHEADIFPSYHVVLEAKKKCYPSPDAFVVNERSAEVKLQALLDNDASRLVKSLHIDNRIFNDMDLVELKMTHKWGTDGSSGHSLYKQKFAEESASNRDGSVLLTAIVPLELRVAESLTNSDYDVIWKNPAPSSTHFCKPIRIQFVKESKVTLLEEERHIQSQIAQLKPSTVLLPDGRSVIITHHLVMSMLDGKARNILTDTSSMATCCACGATPTKMAVQEVVQRPVNTDVFKYGLSVLHCRIRFLECVLHVAYKLELKKWSVNKEVYKDRKEQIQNELRERLGVLVDVVVPGSGSTNDGNTARTFFKNYSVASEVTGVDEGLLFRLSTILDALACGHPIDVEEFHTYCIETAHLFESLYNWYRMPVSMHYVLIHGSLIISTLELAVGDYSEESLEGCNKTVKCFREHRTRKISREATILDLIQRLLLRGDVLISSLRANKKRNLEHLSESVKKLLIIKQE